MNLLHCDYYTWFAREIKKITINVKKKIAFTEIYGIIKLLVDTGR